MSFTQPTMNAGVKVMPIILGLSVVISVGCKSSRDKTPESPVQATESSEKSTEHQGAPAKDPYAEAREAMVKEQIEARGVDDRDVLEALRTVPRHQFVLDRWESRAYSDTPLPIGHDQTISQPFIVAIMSQALQVEPDHRVLEIGTGSGYQAAVLGELANHVYSIEIICDLAERAREALKSEGYDNVRVTCGDGYKGWPEHAPFDRIIVTAAPPEVPRALVNQLAPGGRMVLPVGEQVQELRIIQKDKQGDVQEHDLMKVRFVPMIHGDE